MTDKNEPKTYIIDKFKKSYSSIQEMVAEESRNFAQYAVIIDRLLAEFETYDRIKSLDIKEYAIKIFFELDQLKVECEEWKNKYYASITETKADLIKQIEKLKKDNDEIHEKMATVIYRATGGHLSYSTYTLDAIEQAREDRLAIDVECKTEEYREVINQLKVELQQYKDMAKKGLDNYKDVGGCWGCGISFSFDELLKSYKKLENSYLEVTQELKMRGD